MMPDLSLASIFFLFTFTRLDSSPVQSINQLSTSLNNHSSYSNLHQA
jgi:hypothetical protein